MPNLEMWFPVTIYLEDNLFSKEQNEIWKNRLLEIKQIKKSGGEDWQGNTYTTHNTYDLREDKLFNPLLDSINFHVNEFAKQHSSFAEYKCENFWGNIAIRDNYQEFHTHERSIFSAVYYIEVPEGSGSLVFSDPKEPDMLPLKNFKGRNNLSFVKIGYSPIQGRLLIFRSYLSHMVEPGTNSTERISVSLNFC